MSCRLLFRGRSRKAHDVSDSTEAQKKFGDAKSISSDQYFGGRDPDVSAVLLSWTSCRVIVYFEVCSFCLSLCNGGKNQ